MNFLLHHELALRDLASPAAAAGAMLPDLWRIADRRVRAMHEATDAEGTAGQALREVLAGIRHHVDADRWFHADPVFVDGERATAHALREAAMAMPAARLGLFAHILWELCLDGALVRSRGAAIVDDVKRSLDAASDAAAAAATLHHFARVPRTEVERATFDARMARIFAELSRGPWLTGYASGEGIAERIDGVRARVGFAPLDPPGRAALASVARDLLTRADATLERLVTSFARR